MEFNLYLGGYTTYSLMKAQIIGLALTFNWGLVPDSFLVCFLITYCNDAHIRSLRNSMSLDSLIEFTCLAPFDLLNNVYVRKFL